MSPRVSPPPDAAIRRLWLRGGEIQGLSSPRIPEALRLDMLRLADCALLVRDYDEALAFYVDVLGFELLDDYPIEGKRWVRIKAGPAGLVLRRADTEEQRARIGDQTGHSVFLFVETDNFEQTHQRLLSKGVRFAEAPRHESYGVVAVFFDLYGNRLDLIQPKNARLSTTKSGST
jgi:catechol 2,3-dioxygenase-like lactoylglutathione lyase family enzyme